MTGEPASAGRMNRRRFIKICAVVSAGTILPSTTARSAPDLHRWKGIALGAGAEINLVHEDRAKALDLFRLVEAEIRRLEQVFSLYRQDSELVRLNSNGRLQAPSLDMVTLLGQAHRIHTLTGGAFDPTVQPLWAYHAELAAHGVTPEGAEAENGRLQTILNNIGFQHVNYEPGIVEFCRKGMALTLNGIAQGYITDKVTALLRSRGCRDLVVDLGEISATGHAGAEGAPARNGWPLTLRPDPARPSAQVKVALVDASVASSARTGTTFDETGRSSHILDARTGLPVKGDLEAASVIARSAAFADGLSTAALVCGEQGLADALGHVQEAKAFVVRSAGSAGWLNGRSS